MAKTIRVHKHSIISGKINHMDLAIDPYDLMRYNNGEGLVQQLFPDLNKEEREFLINGMSLEEQHKFYKDEE